MEKTTLSSKGQLVIPKSVREAAHLVPGSVLSVSWVEGELRLRPLAPGGVASLDEVAGCLARPGRKRLDEAQTEAAIKARLKARHAP
ncbi:MAG TPA: AbrB/MazE/SpoVT family DNA-binding domain-containing protein [Quisquiliibacterium sp.]|nr:AbrB/MazE/SpoVT family DNA-binding domain-containing protein [Quisquiliibacterium sp.]